MGAEEKLAEMKGKNGSSPGKPLYFIKTTMGNQIIWASPSTNATGSPIPFSPVY